MQWSKAYLLDEDCPTYILRLMAESVTGQGFAESQLRHFAPLSHSLLLSSFQLYSTLCAILCFVHSISISLISRSHGRPVCLRKPTRHFRSRVCFACYLIKLCAGRIIHHSASLYFTPQKFTDAIPRDFQTHRKEVSQAGLVLYRRGRPHFIAVGRSPILTVLYRRVWKNY